MSVGAKFGVLLGISFVTMPYSWQLLLSGNAAVLAVMHVVSAREDRDKRRRWSAHMDNASLVDLFRLRHTPILR